MDRNSLWLALVAGLVLVGALGYVDLWVRERVARDGWELVPLVVAAVDIDEGTVVTLDMTAQRRLPEQFRTASFVPPESVAYIVGQKIWVSVKKGDPLTWVEFEQPKCGRPSGANAGTAPAGPGFEGGAGARHP